MARKAVFVIFWIVLASLFAGCQPEKIATSPEQAVLQQAERAMGPQAAILSPTIHLRQKVEFDGKTFVMFTYDRVYENHRQPCLVIYETARNQRGFWETGLGDTICITEQGNANVVHPSDETHPADEAQPIEAPHPLDVNGAWRKGARPAEPGLSYAAGLVHQEEIEKVRVSWLDGTEMVVDVIDGSYLAVHSAAVRFKGVRGLGKNDEVLYTFDENAKTE